VLLLMMMACPPKQGAALGPAVPVLPAMAAPMYAWSHGASPDEAVALLAQGLAWDEGLSGAAATLALDLTAGQSIDHPQVRWAAYRSGWPHPVQDVVVQEVSNGEVPARPAGLEGAAAVGVARARGSAGDVWVWATSTPTVDLESFAREQVLGARFEAQAVGGGELAYRLASPSGEITEGPTLLDEQGEWLLELGTGSGAAVVPLYVDMLTPADAPYPWVHETPADTATASEQALTVLDEYRAEFDVSVLEPDPLLDKAAARALAAWTAGTPLPPPEERLGKLGMGGHVAELACTGPSVPSCLDQLYWSVDHRGELVHPDLQYVGLATSIGPGGVSLVIDLAQE